MTPKNNIVDFDRRQHQETPVFPLIDSDGLEILQDRRAHASVYLNKIEITEVNLQEIEFKKLFRTKS